MIRREQQGVINEDVRKRWVEEETIVIPGKWVDVEKD
jgi:hypothetical protein